MGAPAAADLSDLEHLRRGDEQALRRMMSRWTKPMIGFALRYGQGPSEAQDLVAQTFVKFYHHRHRLEPDSNVSAWLFTTLANLCRNQHRWRRRHPTVALEPESGASAALSPSPTPSTLLQQSELTAALQAAVAKLPHKLRTALLLHQYERLSHREIGEILHCSEKTVEMRLYRARHKLRAQLKSFIADGEAG